MPIAEPHPKGRRSSETALTQQHRQPRRRNSLATTAIIENPPSEDSLELRCLPKYTLYIPEHKVRSSHVKLNLPSTSSLNSKDDVSEVLIIPRRSLRSLVNRSREFSPAKYHVYDVAQKLRNSLSLSKINDLGNSMEAVSLNESKSWNPPTSLLDGESPSTGGLGKLADEDDQIADDKYYLVEVGKEADIDPKPEIPDISVSQCVDESQSSLQDSGYSLSQFLTETAPPNDGIDKEVFKDDSQTQPDVENASSSDRHVPKEKISDISDSNNRILIPIEEISVSRENLGEQGNGPSPQSINDMNGSDPFRATKENFSARGSKEDNRYEEGNEDHIAMRQRSISHSSFKLQDLVYKLFHPGQHHEGEDEVEENKTEAEISPSLKAKSSLVYKIFHPGGTKDAGDDREHGHHHPHGQEDTGHETDVDEREHASTSTYRKRKKKRSFVDKILHPHHAHDVDEGKEHYDHGSSAEESEQASANITDSEQSKRHSSSSLENGSSDVDHHKKMNGRKRNVFGFFSSRSGSSEGETALHKGKNDISSDEASKDEPDQKADGALTGEMLQKRHSKEGSGRRRRPPPLPMPPESDRMSSSENLSPHEAVSKPPRNRLRKRSSSKTSSARRSKQTSSEEIETEYADESTRHDNRKMMANLESPDGHARPFFHKFLLNQSYLRPSSTPVSPSGRLSPNGSHRMPSGEDTSPHLEDHQVPEFEALPEPSVESHTYDHAKEFFKEFIHGSPHRRRSHTFSGHIHPGGSSSPKSVPHDDHHLREKYGVCDEVLGKGANGTVRLAHKKSTTPNEKLFAVKRFRKRRKGEKEKEYIKKLTSEFCISSNLHHVNVVETVDLIEDENLGWCEVMEYLPGGNLFDKIATGGELDVFEINCYFRQLINGVTYLHSVGVAHRDLKPENLLLDASGCILKIADFGVSEVFRIVWETKSRKLKGLAGSEPYIAPEEFTIQEYDPTKVDVWACGIIYYAMIHHSVPFLTASENDEQYKSFRKNRLGSYPPIDNLADGPKNMLNLILDPDPDTRTSVEKIREDAWFVAIDYCTTEQKGRYHTHPASKQGSDKNQ